MLKKLSLSFPDHPSDVRDLSPVSNRRQVRFPGWRTAEER